MFPSYVPFAIRLEAFKENKKITGFVELSKLFKVIFVSFTLKVKFPGSSIKVLKVRFIFPSESS